jgi:predicted permease
VLLAAYPRSFRDRYGNEFRRTFAADWQAAGLAGRAGLTLATLGCAFLERLSLLPGHGLKAGQRPGDGMGLDLRAALRDLWRAPAFTLVAVLTLAAGIGINVAAFSIVEAVLLRGLPYPDADRIAGVRISARDGERLNGLSARELRGLEERSDLFAAVGGIRPNFAEVLPMDLDVTGGDRPEKLQGVEVSPGLFAVFGIEPVLGRTIAPEDRDGPDGQALNFMVSHEYWSRALGADADIIGESLTIEYRDKPIVGILPPGVRLLFDPLDGVPQRADLWTRIYHLEDDHYLRTVVRLADGVGFERAQAAVQTLAAGWGEQHPDVYADGPPRIELVPLKSHLTAGSRPLLGALAAAVSLVLLLACANVGSLILARCRARQQEFAVRSALGASSARLRRLIFLEALLLAGMGACVGLLLARFSLRGVAVFAAEVLPRGDELALGGLAVGFAVAAAVMSGLLAGGLAALQRGGADPTSGLRLGARRAGSKASGNYRRVLTVVQTAIAVVLLVGAGLMVRTLLNLAAIDLGFDPAGVLTFKVEMNQTEIPLGQLRYEFFRDVAAEIDRQPEFDSASAIFVLPTHGAFGVDRFGRTQEELESGDYQASFNVVLPGYFETLRVPLLEGEDFRPEWPAGDLGEAIIDERIAARLWPDESAVGQTLWVDWDMQNSPTPRDRVQVRVVGVAPHVLQDGVRGTSVPQIHLPHWHRPFWGMNFVARLRGSATDPASAAAGIRAVREVVDEDPDAVFMHSDRPLTAVVAEASHDGRMLSQVLAVFAALALLLSGAGLYGVIAYGARRRTREIGIRMATGAQRRDVAWLILRGALRLSGAGVLVGVLAAYGVSQLLGSLLYGVATDDPITYFIAGSVLFLVGVVAALRPATRAASVDPIEALRTQ